MLLPSIWRKTACKVSKGTIVDATIINAPTATKNKTKLIHSVAATPAHVHDSQVMEDRLHGEKTRLWGDSALINQIYLKH